MKTNTTYNLKRVFRARVLLLCLLPYLGYCSGNDGNSQANASPPTSTQYQIYGKAITGAQGDKVCQDLNFNYYCEADEPTALLDQNNVYTMSTSVDPQDTQVMLFATSESGSVSDTSGTIATETRKVPMASIVGKTYAISNLTSLVNLEMTTGATEAQAMATVQQKMKVSANDILPPVPSTISAGISGNEISAKLKLAEVGNAILFPTTTLMCYTVDRSTRSKTGAAALGNLVLYIVLVPLTLLVDLGIWVAAATMITSAVLGAGAMALPLGIAAFLGTTGGFLYYQRNNSQSASQNLTAPGGSTFQDGHFQLYMAHRNQVSAEEAQLMTNIQANNADATIRSNTGAVVRQALSNQYTSTITEMNTTFTSLTWSLFKSNYDRLNYRNEMEKIARYAETFMKIPTLSDSALTADDFGTGLRSYLARFSSRPTHEVSSHTITKDGSGNYSDFQIQAYFSYGVYADFSADAELASIWYLDIANPNAGWTKLGEGNTNNCFISCSNAPKEGTFTVTFPRALQKPGARYLVQAVLHGDKSRAYSVVVIKPN